MAWYPEHLIESLPPPVDRRAAAVAAAIAVLDRAATHVEQGWTQGTFLNLTTGGVCLAGAIMLASGATLEDLKNEVPIAAEHVPSCLLAMEAILKEAEIDPTWSLATWNDQAGRTQIEVATTLRNAKRHL